MRKIKRILCGCEYSHAKQDMLIDLDNGKSLKVKKGMAVDKLIEELEKKSFDIRDGE